MRRFPKYAHVFAIVALLFSFGFVPGKKPAVVYRVRADVQAINTGGQERVTEIYLGRLEGLGIRGQDVTISASESVFTVRIAGKYDAATLADVEELLVRQGQLGFWETYNVNEVSGALKESLISRDDTLTDEFFALFSYLDQEQKGPVLGHVLIADTAKTGRLLRKSEASKKLPADLVFAWSIVKTQNDSAYCELVLLKSTSEGKARLDQPQLERAEVITSKYSFLPEISFTLTAPDAKQWAVMTKQNTGRAVSIVIDGKVYSSPTVQGEITGGKSSITGNFTAKEAARLAALLNSPPLPYKMALLEKTVTR